MDNKCEMCQNLDMLCNLHAPKKSRKERIAHCMNSVIQKSMGMYDEKMLAEARKFCEEKNS